MTPRLAHLLVRLYPPPWRERYGEEFEAFLVAEGGGFRTSANVVCSALGEHLSPTGGGKMNRDSHSLGSMTKHPSAFLPVAMSLTALAIVLGDVAINGVVRGTDEGAVAHLWQLLMAAQTPIVAFFAIKWLPQAPRSTLCVLALQVGAALASMAPVFFLNL